SRMQIRRRRRERGRWWASRWTWFSLSLSGWGLLGEGFAEDVDGLLDRSRGGGGAAQRVEHHEVVQRGVVAHQGRAHARLRELAAVRFAFVAKHVVLVDDEEGLRQPLELVDRSAQRRDGVLLAGLRIGRVAVPEPRHGIGAKVESGGELAVA